MFPNRCPRWTAVSASPSVFVGVPFIVRAPLPFVRAPDGPEITVSHRCGSPVAWAWDGLRLSPNLWLETRLTGKLTWVFSAPQECNTVGVG